MARFQSTDLDFQKASRALNLLLQTATVDTQDQVALTTISTNKKLHIYDNGAARTILDARDVSSNTNFAVDTTLVPTRGSVATYVQGLLTGLQQDGEGITYNTISGSYDIGGGDPITRNAILTLAGSPSSSFEVSQNFINATRTLLINESQMSFRAINLNGRGVSYRVLTPNSSTVTGEILVTDNGVNSARILMDSALTNTPFTISSTSSSFVGLVYAADYTANFGVRSLVDRGYVDAAISSTAKTFSNGLTETSNVVRLGGTLTQNTTIDGAFSLNFNGLTAFNFIGNGTTSDFSVSNADIITLASANTIELNTGTFTLTNSDTIVTTNSVSVTGTNAGDLSFVDFNNVILTVADNITVTSSIVSLTAETTINGDFYLNANQAELNTTTTLNANIGTAFNVTLDTNANFKVVGDGTTGSIELSNVNDIVVDARLIILNNPFQNLTFDNTTETTTFTDNATLARGIQYAADYSLTFTNRSLVDKAYVDALVTGVGTFKGGWDASLGTTPTGANINAGDYYRITVAGVLTGLLSGNPSVQVGDIIVANVSNPTGNSNYFALQSNFATASDVVIGGTFTPQSGVITGTDDVKTALEKLQFTANNTNIQTVINNTDYSSLSSINLGGSSYNVAQGKIGVSSTSEAHVLSNSITVGDESYAYWLLISDSRASLNETGVNNIDINLLNYTRRVDSRGITYTNENLGDSNRLLMNVLGAGLIYENNLDDFGIRYLGFGETSLTVAGAVNYSTLAFNSLVPRKYVDDAIAATSFTFTNGLTATSGVVRLGGTLTQNTSINGGGFNLGIDLDGGAMDLFTNGGTMTLDTNGGNINILSQEGNVVINAGTTGSLTLSANIGTVTTQDAEGLKYSANYAATFVARSLVDKGYVDAAVTSATPRYKVTQNIIAGATVVTHNLNSQDIVVQVWINDGGTLTNVNLDYDLTSVNSITINSNVAYTNARIIVLAL